MTTVEPDNLNYLDEENIPQDQHEDITVEEPGDFAQATRDAERMEETSSNGDDDEDDDDDDDEEEEES